MTVIGFLFGVLCFAVILWLVIQAGLLKKPPYN